MRYYLIILTNYVNFKFRLLVLPAEFMTILHYGFHLKSWLMLMMNFSLPSGLLIAGYPHVGMQIMPVLLHISTSKQWFKAWPVLMLTSCRLIGSQMISGILLKISMRSSRYFLYWISQSSTTIDKMFSFLRTLLSFSPRLKYLLWLMYCLLSISFEKVWNWLSLTNQLGQIVQMKSRIVTLMNLMTLHSFVKHRLSFELLQKHQWCCLTSILIWSGSVTSMFLQ